MRELAGAGITGGRIYEGAIAAAARKGKCDENLTWHTRDFTGGLPGPRAVMRRPERSRAKAAERASVVTASGSATPRPRCATLSAS